MAKKNILLIKLQSSADTGYYYVTKKNPKTKTEKLKFKKYGGMQKITVYSILIFKYIIH